MQVKQPPRSSRTRKLRSPLEEALELLEGKFDSPELRAGLSLGLSRLSYAIDHGAAAIRYAEAALSLYESLGDVACERQRATLCWEASSPCLVNRRQTSASLKRTFRKAEATLCEGPEGKAFARFYIGIAATTFMSLRTKEGLASWKTGDGNRGAVSR